MSAHVENRSRFAAEDFLLWDGQGRDVLVVCVAGRFDLPPAGCSTTGPLRVCDVQMPPPAADVYWGEPERSSLRVEGQRVYTRPGTDVYVSGHAWAPGGRAAREGTVGVRVGTCRQVARVWGPRVWRRGALGLRPSAPEAFESVPLRWELSVGGAGEPANPVGLGLYPTASAAVDGPLPQLEDPEHLLESPTQRVVPVGFGPVARHWQPRRARAGTYDARWVESRAPLWPEDFDERFFQAAAPGLNAAEGLRGGEAVVLVGMHADGRREFLLPRVGLEVETHLRRRVETRALVLDAVHLEVDEGAVTLLWRAAIRMHRELAEYEGSVVREVAA